MSQYRNPVEPKEKQLKRLLQELLNTEAEEGLQPHYPNHYEAIEPWKRAMASGTLTGKVFSSHTVNNYARYAYNSSPNTAISALMLFKRNWSKFHPNVLVDAINILKAFSALPGSWSENTAFLPPS